MSRTLLSCLLAAFLGWGCPTQGTTSSGTNEADDDERSGEAANLAEASSPEASYDAPNDHGDADSSEGVDATGCELIGSMHEEALRTVINGWQPRLGEIPTPLRSFPVFCDEAGSEAWGLVIQTVQPSADDSAILGLFDVVRLGRTAEPVATLELLLSDYYGGESVDHFATGDVNGDGQSELLLRTVMHDEGMNVTRVRAYDRHGETAAPDWFGVPFSQVAWTDDLNADGQLDIWIYSYRIDTPDRCGPGGLVEYAFTVPAIATEGGTYSTEHPAARAILEEKCSALDVESTVRADPDQWLERIACATVLGEDSAELFAALASHCSQPESSQCDSGCDIQGFVRAWARRVQSDDSE